MRVVRPFPKELLKKMFIKVLHKNGNMNIFNSEKSNFISIICEILTHQFQVSELSENEFNEIIKAVNELEEDGFIVRDFSSTSSKTKILTEKGIEYASVKLANFMLPVLEIENFITRIDLRELCLQDYLNGDYEPSILKAFTLLEEKTKTKTVKPSIIISKEKLSDSYISSDGIFKDNQEDSVLGIDSIQRIMLGTMFWFNNSPEEKAKTFNNSQAAAQVLLFANIHLNLIDQKKVAI